MEYRCVATSVEGFVQQLAVAYITHGYWFYVAGTIPDDKDPAAVDAKLIDRYGIAISKWARCRRKKQGLANMQYLRHERFFVLLATKGRHEFFERERASIRDVRRVSIKFAGYSIASRKGRDGRWHASVRIAAGTLAELRAAIQEAGVSMGCKAVRWILADASKLRFTPVERQLYHALRVANRARRTAGLSASSSDAAQGERRVVRSSAAQPFKSDGA